MKRATILYTLLIARSICSMIKQPHETLSFPEFIKKGPCFIHGYKPGAETNPSIEVEYYYWIESKGQSPKIYRLIVNRIETSENTVNNPSTLWHIYGPVEDKLIINPYFFQNQTKFCYTFKKKHKLHEQDIEDIKKLINLLASNFQSK